MKMRFFLIPFLAIILAGVGCQTNNKTSNECNENNPCSGDFICVDNQCEAVAECSEDTDCDQDRFCYKGNCEKKVSPVNDGGRGTKITPENTEENILTLNSLAFTLPSDWKIESQDQDSATAKINVPDQKYHVVIPFKITEESQETINRLKLSSEPVLKESETGTKVYFEACAPASYCAYVVVNGKTYLATFETPESNEPVPENLDGVWFPGTSVTDDQFLQVIVSAK